MKNRIILSIKPKFIEKIASKQKNHEFRKYRTKNDIEFMYIYVTSPISQLKYIAQVKSPIKCPSQVSQYGYGNMDFNEGKKDAIYAYPIIHLTELLNPISLYELKNKFGIHPPQAFMYLPEQLKEYIYNSPLTKLF